MATVLLKATLNSLNKPTTVLLRVATLKAVTRPAPQVYVEWTVPDRAHDAATECFEEGRLTFPSRACNTSRVLLPCSRSSDLADACRDVSQLFAAALSVRKDASVALTAASAAWTAVRRAAWRSLWASTMAARG